MNRCDHRMRHTGNRCQLPEWHDGRHAHDPADEAATTQREIFALVLAGGDGNRLRAAELIRKLGPEAKRDLRAVCQEVEELLDTVWLEQLREKRRK